MKNDIDQMLSARIRELRENTDFVSTVFENLIGYAIIAADFDGNILAYNEGARHIYGYAPHEIIGVENIDIFFPKDFIEAGELQQIIDDLVGKERFSYEGQKVRKNGDRFPAQVLFTLTKDKNGKVVGFIEIVEDLTERKRAEETQARATAERIKQLERELHSIERLSGSSQTAVTAHTFGLVSVREGYPEMFHELVQHYGDVMDLALEKRSYRVEHNISEPLQSLAERLGLLRAGPRDVVDVHHAALRSKSARVTPQKLQAYIEEGRLMVLELMGYVASYYRNFSVGFTRTSASDRDKTKGDDTPNKGEAA
jgi:PAS domain S-box-containing protein